MLRTFATNHCTLLPLFVCLCHLIVKHSLKFDIFKLISLPFVPCQIDGIQWHTLYVYSSLNSSTEHWSELRAVKEPSNFLPFPVSNDWATESKRKTIEFNWIWKYANIVFCWQSHIENSSVYVSSNIGIQKLLNWKISIWMIFLKFKFSLGLSLITIVKIALLK